MYTQGAILIAEERNRQVEKEGNLDYERLAYMGAAYAMLVIDRLQVESLNGGLEANFISPFGDFHLDDIVSAWRPQDDSICNLVRAGALIAAEVDRRLGLKADKAKGYDADLIANLYET